MHVNNDLNLIINVVKSYAWINLMPGGKPSFHFSGKIKIENISEESIESLRLRQITIYKDTLEILKFIPEFINLNDKSKNNFQPKESMEFSIAAPDKMKIDSLLNVNLVDLLLNFTSGGKTFIYKIENVKIERVY
ncbi:MAG: hypothetical protein WCA84_07395 [Ignavibacteriaceae bacterium]